MRTHHLRIRLSFEDPVAVIVTTSREVIQCVSSPFGYREGPRPLARER